MHPIFRKYSINRGGLVSILPSPFLLVLLVLGALLFLSLSTPALSGEREIVKKEKNLEDVKRQIREGKEFVKEMSGREGSILSDIEKISRSLTAIRGELKLTEGELKRIKGDIKGVEGRVGLLRADKLRLAGRLKERLRAIYMMRTGEAVKVLFSPGGSGSLGRGGKFLTVIMEADRKLIEECEANLNELSIELARLDELKGEQEKVLVAHKNKKRRAESKRVERRRLLKKTKNEKTELTRFIAELETAATELSTLVESLKKDKVKADYTSGFGAMRGRLIMPVKGKVVQHYGKVKHPKFKTITFNNGIIIAAPLGEAVRSVYKGRVAYVGWLKGYGQVMIVEHEGGFYTLYGQLFKLLKAKGDQVGKGEDLGLVGDSGLHDSPGLYFEVREGGVPRDPLGWLLAGR